MRTAARQAVLNGADETAHAGPWRVQVARDYSEMSEWAADELVVELRRKPDLLMCASSGATPTGLYGALARRRRERPALFRRFRVVKVDEWAGMDRWDPGSCERDIVTHLLKPLGIGANRYVGFNGKARDPLAECRRVAERVATGGPIDVCVLGLGLNGHVALNEPAAAMEPRAHVVELSRQSMRHPMLQKSARKPRRGLTLGLAEILASRRILLLVSGTHKREVLRRLFRPRVTPRFPASFLWLHSNVTLLCDAPAAGLDTRVKR